MKEKTLLDVLKEKVPDLIYDEFTLVIGQEFITSCPQDWMEFVMVAVSAQTGGSGLPNFVCLDDEETALAFKIIANEEANLFVMGHPSRTDFKIWQLKVIKNINDEAIFVGGENFREFCDTKNLFYRSTLNDKGQLLSCSDCVYLKHDGEDCRKPLTEEEIKNY